MTSNPTTAGVRGILLDIEGTTTPLAFVHEVLFPHARSQVKDYLVKHFREAETIADLAKLREEHALDVEQDLKPPPLIDGPEVTEINSVVSYVHWLIDRDRKSLGLKSLQGKIWKQGYLEGTLRAPLFADVVPALGRWRRMGVKISIFSSGSVLAQKLLFAHTEFGDVTNFIDDYFDTTIGSKTAIESYQRIALALRLTPREVLFISDVVAELDAASSSGMRTLLCVRPGNSQQPSTERHQTIQDFEGVLLL